MSYYYDNDDVAKKGLTKGKSFTTNPIIGAPINNNNKMLSDINTRTRNDEKVLKIIKKFCSKKFKRGELEAYKIMLDLPKGREYVALLSKLNTMRENLGNRLKNLQLYYSDEAKYTAYSKVILTKDSESEYIKKVIKEVDAVIEEIQLSIEESYGKNI